MLRKLAFNFWYFRHPPWDTGISPPELLAFIENHPPGRALDLGCGTGTNALTLAHHGWQVIGIDFAWKAVWSARMKASQQALPVKFFTDDVTNIKHASGRYDLILDIGCFHGLTPLGRQKYLKGLIQRLAVGGTFLLYVFIKNDPALSGRGVSESELQDISTELVLVERIDSLDKGWGSPSAWLTYQNILPTKRKSLRPNLIPFHLVFDPFLAVLPAPRAHQQWISACVVFRISAMTYAPRKPVPPVSNFQFP